MKYIPYLVLLLLFSCASEKPKGDTEAEVLFKEALQLKEESRFILATQRLNDLRNRYPYSYYATPSELLLADILFLQESFTDSAAAYLIFKDFHPKHEKIPYVVYKIAESFNMQVPDTEDRDLQPAFEAIKYYKVVQDQYPSSEYAKDAGKNIKKNRVKILAKEKYIADFYFKTEVFDAARWRYLYILENFDDKKLQKHSMERVIQTSAYLKDYSTCNEYINGFTGKLDMKNIMDEVKTCQKRTK